LTFQQLVDTCFLEAFPLLLPPQLWTLPKRYEMKIPSLYSSALYLSRMNGQ